MEATVTPRYSFAAMNTACGFQGRFKEIFGDVQELYIIKGGPGTGKSRFISEIGKQAEQNGRDVEYFYCSSDPSSFDGVIFTDRSGTGRVGIIDGTAPHSYDPIAPGAIDRILNFGDFWNEDILRSEKELIVELSNAKAALYSSAYSYLAAIARLDSITEAHALRALNTGKLSSAIKRMLRALPMGSGYHETLRIRSAVSCNGAVNLGFYTEIAKNKYAVLDCALSANAFMRALIQELRRLEQPVVLSYSPFFPDTPDAIYIPGADTAFYVGSAGCEDEKTVNMRRFTADDRLRPYKPKLRAIAAVRRQLLALLFSELAGVRSLHAKTEELYAGAMDFEKKEELTRKLAEQLFG
ncbi:MAG: hypothetical protein IJY04_04270 [Clostridia bacterium]|nr:hypothetical protein [Clostridia bacterium]